MSRNEKKSRSTFFRIKQIYIAIKKNAAEKTKFELEQIDENHACLYLQEINFLP